LAQEYLTKNGITVSKTSHPDLAPADYYLFLRIKSILKKCRFQSGEEVKQSTMVALKVTGNGPQEVSSSAMAAGTNV
jgi:hypothetical protein